MAVAAALAALLLGGCGGSAPAPSAQTATASPSTTRLSTSYGFTVWRRPGESYAQARGRQSAVLGAPQVLRYFYGSNALEWPVEQGATGRTPLIVSFKRPPAQVRSGWYDEEITAWLAKLPTDRPTWIAYEHEMDAKVARGEYAVDDAKAAFQHVSDLIAEQGNPQLRSTLILTGFQLEVRLRELWPGRSHVDVLAVDTYRWGGQEKASDLFRDSLRLARRHKVPLGLSEFGLWQGSDDARADFLAEALAYLDGRVAWVTYFDADRSDVAGDHDWEISDRPAAARAWRSLTQRP